MMTHVFKVKLSLLVLSNHCFFGLHLIPELVYLLFHLRRMSLMPFSVLEDLNFFDEEQVLLCPQCFQCTLVTFLLSLNDLSLNLFQSIRLIKLHDHILCVISHFYFNRATYLDSLFDFMLQVFLFNLFRV